MKKMIVFMLMVLISLPAFAFAHESNVGGKKGKAHSDNGKHKGWYKDGHKHGKKGHNVKGKGHSKKKDHNAPYASGTYQKPTSTVTNGGQAKNTGGATAKPATTSQGGVSKGSATMSHTGGAAVKPATTSGGGVTKGSATVSYTGGALKN